MDILITRLLFDVGLMVLIWLVQLVIYPGFKYYSPSQLKKWHTFYTGRIAIVVAPLMTGQFAVAGFQLWEQQNTYTIGSIIIIIIIWNLTFFLFVPFHTAIEEDASNRAIIKNLVKKNWIRTFLWSGLFFWSLYWLL